MEFKVHDGIVNIKETDKIEIKKAGNRIPMSLYETYSAFCNTGGGYIILGLEEISNDKYKVVGINDPDRYILKPLQPYYGTILPTIGIMIEI